MAPRIRISHADDGVPQSGGHNRIPQWPKIRQEAKLDTPPVHLGLEIIQDLYARGDN
jgi:hypothetical protein